MARSRWWNPTFIFITTDVAKGMDTTQLLTLQNIFGKNKTKQNKKKTKKKQQQQQQKKKT